MDEPLKIQIIDGQLTITIGVATLAHSASKSPDMAGVTIENVNVFAQSIVDRLHDEEEDGNTLVHRMFDAAFVAAVEDGSEGIAYSD